MTHPQKYSQVGVFTGRAQLAPGPEKSAKGTREYVPSSIVQCERDKERKRKEEWEKQIAHGLQRLMTHAPSRFLTSLCPGSTRLHAYHAIHTSQLYTAYEEARGPHSIPITQFSLNGLSRPLLCDAAMQIDTRWTYVRTLSVAELDRAELQRLTAGRGSGPASQPAPQHHSAAASLHCVRRLAAETLALGVLSTPIRARDNLHTFIICRMGLSPTPRFHSRTTSLLFSPIFSSVPFLPPPLYPLPLCVCMCCVS